MTKRGVAIKYGDVAPEAKENFVPTASESKFDNLSQLNVYNLDVPNYANPCELYQTVLDGLGTPFPSNPENAKLGLWSEQVSGADGIFATPIVLNLKAEGQYSSQGFTLTFDTHNNIFCNHLLIKWYRNGEQIDSAEFNPDNAFYFCHKRVDNYDEVEITFYSVNMPFNRLKLRAIDYGYGTVFYGNELRSTKLIQEIDPISAEISINTADFVLDSKNDIDYSFQAKQPLSVYFNGQLKATTFVKSAKRKARFLWQIQSEDYIGLMDTVPFNGGIYNNADAYEVLENIFTTAKVPYSINEALRGVKLFGHIPLTTCRDALMQVAFAVQNVVDTSNSDKVNVFALDEEVKQIIPLNRIKQGQNFVDDDTVTAVEVTAHSYKVGNETLEAYDADQSGAGENIFVKFSQPLHSLEITNGNIVESNANYAIININAGGILTGKKYEHTTQTKRINNPIVLKSEPEKVLSINNATLVSPHNVDNVLNKCYNWLVRVNSVNLKIVEGRHIGDPIYAKYGSAKYGEQIYKKQIGNEIVYDEPVMVGDMIEAETEYLGNVQGRIIKQSFGLIGNIIVKEAVLK